MLNFFFDSTGRGTLMNAFGRIWDTGIVGVEFGGKPTERRVSKQISTLCKDYYSKFVSELWWSVRLAVESKQRIEADQKRFLRHARPWWDSHRHRIAPQVGATVERMMAEGRLEVIAGRIGSLREIDGGLEAVIRRRRAPDDDPPRRFAVGINAALLVTLRSCAPGTGPARRSGTRRGVRIWWP